MFGSSFLSSLEPSTTSSSSSGGGAAASSSSGGFFAPKSSTEATTTSTTTSKSSNEGAPPPSLPFAGFGLGASSNSKTTTAAAGGAGSNSSSAGGFSFGGAAAIMSSSSPATNNISSTSANLFGGSSSSSSPPSSSSTSANQPSFGGFGAIKSSTTTASNTAGNNNSKMTNLSPFSNAAAAAAQASKQKLGAGGQQVVVSSSALVPTSRSTTTSSTAPTSITNTNNRSSSSSSNNNTNNQNQNKNKSIENSCISSNGRTYHTYHYDTNLQQHVIISNVAPFGNNNNSSSFSSPDCGTPRNNYDNSSSALQIKITTVLPTSISDSLNIDTVIGLLCVDDESSDHGTKKLQCLRRRSKATQPQQQNNNDGNGNNENDAVRESMKLLPTLCLYTHSSVFLLDIGYHHQQPSEDESTTNINNNINNGTILQIHEPFEKQLLMAPTGSSILRIRSLSASSSSSSSSSNNVMFVRNGSLAMLLREGDVDDTMVGYAIVLYHGFMSDNNKLGGGRRGSSTINSSSSNEGGAVTTPLRFNHVDLVRGLHDTMDVENEAYTISSLRAGGGGGGQHQSSPSSYALGGATTSLSTTNKKSVVDFCFNTNGSSGGCLFSLTSILLLCTDGSIYAASPIIFDGSVFPRSIVLSAITQLNDEINASSIYLQSMNQSTPAPTLECERVEARMKQCKAGKRYLLDVFGIPDGMMVSNGNSSSSGAATAVQGGSYYVSASVIHSRPSSGGGYNDDDYGGGGGYHSQALAWQPRLQGPLIVIPPSSKEQMDGGDDQFSSYACIESFGGASSAGIIDGFVVTRNNSCNKASSSPIHVEFGIIPGEGSVILPRFEFESDGDCQLIDDMVRGTGMYVERASIMSDSATSEGEADEQHSSRALSIASSSSSNDRNCSIVVDPLDEIMVHVITPTRIVTVTTNAISVTANCFKSRVDVGGGTANSDDMSSIRTKVWSGLEVSLNDASLVGARVSGDVHLGHILLASVSNGSLEVVNITAAQCLYETSEQMKVRAEQLDATIGTDDKALEILKRVKPLHELLQPLIDKVCDGLSKMGKIVGGATLPKDAGPENLAVFLDTQNSCESNILMPMEEMSKIISTRRELLTEMYNHQSAELVRLAALLDDFKKKYEANKKRVAALEVKASVLTERSSAVLTATRDLQPTVTDAEVAYFKDLKRYETSCNKWEGTVDQLEKDITKSCDAMSAGAIEKGDVSCLVELPPEKIEVCHKLLRGEARMLKKIEQKVKGASDTVEEISKIISGLDSEDAARLDGGNKENQKS